MASISELLEKLKPNSQSQIIQGIYELVKEQDEFEQKLLYPYSVLLNELNQLEKERDKWDIINKGINPHSKEIYALREKMRSVEMELYDKMELFRREQIKKLDMLRVPMMKSSEPSELMNQVWVLAPYIDYINQHYR
jgi:hypothetical protein